MPLTEKQLMNRVQWVRDLLSGEFAQGNHALKIKNTDGSFKYCCLGVACERIAPKSKAMSVAMIGYSQEYMAIRTGEITLGLSEEDQIKAAVWNDDKKFSFQSIADYVAYATEHDMSFNAIDPRSVHADYAIEWLKQFD